MKTARLIILIGGIVQIVTACLHGSGFLFLGRRISGEHIAAETAAILKTCWLAFSVELIALAIVAILARSMERGAGIVLFCAFVVDVNGALMLAFLGPFIGFWMVALDTVLLGLGGYLLQKASRKAA